MILTLLKENKYNNCTQKIGKKHTKMLLLVLQKLKLCLIFTLYIDLAYKFSTIYWFH